MAEDEMVGWHHPLNEQDFQQTPVNSEGQGTLMCCSPWGSQRVRHDLATSLHLYGCESWTIKKAECQRIDAFEL